MDSEALTTGFERVFAKIAADVEENGFSFIGVGRTEHDEPGPAFGYSVGMWQSWGQPEVLLVGLPMNRMHAIAWEIADLASGGEVLKAGEEHVGLLKDGYAFNFREIAPPHSPLNLAVVFYSGHEFEAVQAVYPDKMHRFPWNEGYDLNPLVQPLVLGDGKEGL